MSLFFFLQSCCHTQIYWNIMPFNTTQSRYKHLFIHSLVWEEGRVATALLMSVHYWFLSFSWVSPSFCEILWKWYTENTIALCCLKVCICTLLVYLVLPGILHNRLESYWIVLDYLDSSILVVLKSRAVFPVLQHYAEGVEPLHWSHNRAL